MLVNNTFERPRNVIKTIPAGGGWRNSKNTKNLN
jgi:hypothetical protein